VEGSCEHGNEPPGSIKCWEVLSIIAMGYGLDGPVSIPSSARFFSSP
jgi:hypothetical protein